MWRLSCLISIKQDTLTTSIDPLILPPPTQTKLINPPPSPNPKPGGRQSIDGI
ncbi:hypothetical protein PGTUg99_009374 [Puccinia graminis f. sp. tritici]|uniref:Uncharacterized protein n=1 Tax=Puccinia graminis f. sp. tritici TaxID=56615 RepID=A0A5B0RR90_PUCGR|nr:hypothetical protein PGTUg99_009374 [Puccinia graminis f. sp. tritici]